MNLFDSPKTAFFFAKKELPYKIKHIKQELKEQVSNFKVVILTQS